MRSPCTTTREQPLLPTSRGSIHAAREIQKGQKQMGMLKNKCLKNTAVCIHVNPKLPKYLSPPPFLTSNHIGV